MKFKAEKPTAPGTFLYKEGDKIVTVDVRRHEDLQSGISKSLVAQPIPPRWKNLPVPVWYVSDLTGVFYDLEPDETLEDRESPCVLRAASGSRTTGTPSGVFAWPWTFP